MSLLDEAFELLETAKRMEQSEGNQIEAATKYYEAVYLMRQYLQRLPHTSQEVQARKLVEEKILHYSNLASQLLSADDQSTIARSITSNPRMPVSRKCFFNEDSSVIPMKPPTPPVPPSSPRRPTSAILYNKAGLANSKLSQAISYDERGQTNAAINSYMTAAQMYLETIKISENEPGLASITQGLKRRLEGALDRIEQLKQSNSKGRHVVQQQKSRDIHEMEEVHRSSLTDEEKAVLIRSSRITSGLFMPWSDDDANKLSSIVASGLCTTLYTDPSGELPLSEKQKKRFYHWARPSEIIQKRKRMGIKQYEPIMIRNITPYTIRQQFVTDCSFIASLCICAAFERRFRKSLITSIIYPHNKEGIPVYNPNGKYMVKLWLNGVARQVIVDDKLPIDKHGNLLCSHTTGSRNQLELWVSVIEKAYMKLCGGYDFPGSNSGVDLFSLTGWIPERIFFARDPQKVKDYETPPDRAWERLCSANSFGDCLITVATTKEISNAQADSLGLVTGHAYAVLDAIQTKNGTKLLQLKNPWASKGWTGKFSCYDTSSWSDVSLREEVGYNPEVAAKHDDGVFWIRWEEVLVYFQNLQLSWNPALFPHRITTHSFWPKSQGPYDDTFNVGENPQYIMSLSQEAIAKKATIWILISRHVTKQEQEGCEVKDFLTIHLLKNTSSQDKIWYPHGPNTLVHGAYTNNPHVLTRYDVTGPADEFISLVLSQYQKSHDMGYTLSCFCTEPFAIGKPQKELPYVKEVPSSWTAATAGGPVGNKDFFRNPMFALRLKEDSIIQLQCSTVRAFAVNVVLLALEQGMGGCRDARNLTRASGRPVIDSGNYRHGFVVTERRRIPPGDYALVVSTFQQDQVGAFYVKISSSKKLTIDAMP